MNISKKNLIAVVAAIVAALLVGVWITPQARPLVAAAAVAFSIGFITFDPVLDDDGCAPAYMRTILGMLVDLLLIGMIISVFVCIPLYVLDPEMSQSTLGYSTLAASAGLLVGMYLRHKLTERGN